MVLDAFESGVGPHQLQHLTPTPESVVIPWVFFCKASLNTSFRTLWMFLLSSVDLLLVWLRCGKWLHKIWSHRLGESGVSAETLLAPTLYCGSQATLLVSSPRTLHEGAVAYSSGKVQSVCAFLVFCYAVPEQQVSCLEVPQLSFLTDCWIACMNLIFFLTLAVTSEIIPSILFLPSPGDMQLHMENCSAILKCFQCLSTFCLYRLFCCLLRNKQNFSWVWKAVSTISQTANFFWLHQKNWIQN